jgi:hypothetical protein
MVTTSMKWVSLTALLLVVLLRPSASHQVALDFLICAGAFMIVVTIGNLVSPSSSVNGDPLYDFANH